MGIEIVILAGVGLFISIAINLVLVAYVRQNIVKVFTIAEEAAEEIDMLQDLIMAATNEAMDKAHQLAQDKLNAITGGFKIPGLT